MKYQLDNITGGLYGPLTSNETSAASLAKSRVRTGSKTSSRILGGPHTFALAALFTFAVAIATATDTPEATIAYRPGDTVRVFVTFNEPISLKGALVRFSLQGQLPEGQKVFTNFFDVASPVKSSEREFELTGKIGDHVASGTYQIVFMTAENEGDLSRTFNAGQDFPTIKLCVRNDRKVEFPDVKSIKLGQPAIRL
jgi:hypothetical protein